MASNKPRKMQMNYEVFKSQVYEGGIGYCINCHEQHDDYVDPDGRDLWCNQCNTNGVHGLDEMLMMGMIEFTGDDDEDHEEEGD